MKGYYKTIDGEVVELEQKNNLMFRYMYIVELVIPDGCVAVSCENNQLKGLVIPDGCEWVRVDMKSVTELNKVDSLYLYL